MVALAGKLLEKFGRCCQLVYEDAVARYAALQLRDALLALVATLVGAYHVAHGAYRYDDGEDGDDSRQRHPKVFG